LAIMQVLAEVGVPREDHIERQCDTRYFKQDKANAGKASLINSIFPTAPAYEYASDLHPPR